MARRSRRSSRRSRRSTRRRSYRRSGGRISIAKKSLRKRHRGAKYVCRHPRSGKKTYHRTKRAAKRACGK